MNWEVRRASCGTGRSAPAFSLRNSTNGSSRCGHRRTWVRRGPRPSPSGLQITRLRADDDLPLAGYPLTWRVPFAFDVDPRLLGAAYSIPTVIVPLLLVIHVMTFALLLRREGPNPAAS